MSSLERTAYPRFPKLLTPHDLEQFFSPSAEDTEWVQSFARQTDRQLALMLHLQCFAYLHYFIAIEQIPPDVVQHVAACMGIVPQDEIRYPDAHRSLYRHHESTENSWASSGGFRTNVTADFGIVTEDFGPS